MWDMLKEKIDCPKSKMEIVELIVKRQPTKAAFSGVWNCCDDDCCSFLYSFFKGSYGFCNIWIRRHFMKGNNAYKSMYSEYFFPR